MPKKSKEVAPSEPPVINLTKYSQLSESLAIPESDNVVQLYDMANALLDQAGQETSINGLAVTATPQSFIVKNGEQTLHARVARMKGVGGEDTAFPSIVFCTNDNFEDLSSTYMTALSFRPGQINDIHLQAGTGNNNGVDLPEYVELAKTIIDDLTAQYGTERKAQTLAHDEEQKAIKKAEKQRAKRRSHRIHAIGGWTLTGVLLWAPQFSGLQNVDAKIGSLPAVGTIPMPDVVEWIVDLANQPDHIAQGFPEPVGAEPLAVGQDITDVPLLTDYDTKHVPDASYADYDEDFYRGYVDELSKPGLYNSDFTFDNSSKVSAVFDQYGCYSIKGDYTDGKTSVFTQTANLSKMVKLVVNDTHSLEVCKVPGAPANSAGSIYLYQKH